MTIIDGDKRVTRTLQKKAADCPAYTRAVVAVAAKRAQLIADGKLPAEARELCKTAAELGDLRFFGLP